MKFHVVAFPHTVTNKAYCHCAYTQKTLNFCKMMTSLGHTVFHYGTEGSTVEAEHVTIITENQRQAWFPREDGYPEITCDITEPYWNFSNNRAIQEIEKRIEPKDFICLINYAQRPIAAAFPGHRSVEYGIGYSMGTFAKYRVFESDAWRKHIQQEGGRVEPYDAVIPNYFDPADFPFSEQKDDYFLFVGRMIENKGIIEAARACHAAGAKLIMAGRSACNQYQIDRVHNGLCTLRNVEQIGSIGVQRRGELMSRARALFVLTKYLPPFEGVSIEAMLCGTPVITSNHGCFLETIVPGVGFRADPESQPEIRKAMDAVASLDPHFIRDYAVKNFSLDVVRHRYQAYFNGL